MVDKRPDPDQLLKQAEAEETTRGKLKIFFGASAGVGKTYAMLLAARQRKKEGVDVVVGYVETHKRAETDALLEGLEQLPPKIIQYKNVSLREFDVDAALKRRPFLVLVDELAHTNAPGSRHLKRWQDIEELLQSGIHVYTTLNVQHCESVNDVVAQVTNIVVRETVPDTLIEEADEIELIDLPPDDLLKRLKEGKVYLEKQAERAVENFFQPGNLIALRQLALRYTAKNVDTKMLRFKEMHSVSRIWNVGERFLVCISPSPSALRIIRAAKRIASEIGAPWTVVYVETPNSLRNPEVDRNRVSEMMRFAEKLGAETDSLTGQNVSDELIAYARSKNISKIIIGKPERSKWQELLKGSIVNELARKSGEIDLYVLSGEKHEGAVFPKPEFREKLSWRGAISAFTVVFICTGINKLLSNYLVWANLIMIYLLGVVWIAFHHGRRISFLTSFLSVITFDFLFVPPYYSFAVADAEYIIMFLIMLTVGLVVSTLSGRLRQQTIAMRSREERAQTLYTMNRDLAKTSDPEEIIQVAVNNIEDLFKCPAIISRPDAKSKHLYTSMGRFGQASLTSSEEAVISWVYEYKKPAGNGTDTLPGSLGLYIPLVSSEKAFGVLGVFPKNENPSLLDPDRFHLLELFASQTASALEGAELAADKIRVENAIEEERFRNFILSAFSFDLPGPLSVISQAATELLNPANQDDMLKRKALIEKIRDETKRLNDLALELPEIIRMEDKKE